MAWPILVVLTGAAVLGHKTGVLQQAARKVSVAAAAYAATHPAGAGPSEAAPSSSSSSSAAGQQQQWYDENQNQQQHGGEDRQQQQSQSSYQHSAQPTSFRYKEFEGAWASAATMPNEEAMLILGFDPNVAVPEPKEVQKQHRALMMHFHADVGGPAVIAQKLNLARDVLMPQK